MVSLSTSYISNHLHLVQTDNTYPICSSSQSDFEKNPLFRLNPRGLNGAGQAYGATLILQSKSVWTQKKGGVQRGSRLVPSFFTRLFLKYQHTST